MLSSSRPSPRLTAAPLPVAALFALPLLGGDPPPPLLPPVNHGPGTTGGGSNTSSGETLRQGAFEIELRTEYTTFDDASRAEAEAKATQVGEFDSIESTFIQSVALFYGFSDDLQLGVQTGYYHGSNFIDAEDDGGGPESSTADPAGLTDTWLTAKYRLVRGAYGHLALQGGVKLPTGDDDDTLDNFEELEPSSQAGSGSVDYQAGLAYSRYLTSHVTLDASAFYTLRTEHDDFEVGDRADLGLALAYRLTEDVQAPNNWSVFGELSGVWLGKDEDEGEANDNSGGEVLYLTLGVRDRITKNVALSLAPSLPIYQDENGEQVEVDARVAFDVTFSL